MKESRSAINQGLSAAVHHETLLARLDRSNPALGAFVRDPAAMTGLCLLLLIASLALLAPWLAGERVPVKTSGLAADSLGATTVGRLMFDIAKHHVAGVALLQGLLGAIRRRRAGQPDDSDRLGRQRAHPP